MKRLHGKLHTLQAELTDRDEALVHANAHHENAKRHFAATTDTMQVKLAESEKLRHSIVIENAKAAAGLEHDYNSPFTPPSELVKDVKQLSDNCFADWLEVAGDSVGEWMKDDVDERAAQLAMKQVLVATVHQCHLFVQATVEDRLRFLDKFLGREHKEVDDTDGPEDPAYIKNLTLNAFQQAHRRMFAEFYPVDQENSTLVTDIVRTVSREVPDARCQSLLCTRAPQQLLSALIVRVLRTFLECELTRPAPLKFLDSFGEKEMWAENMHSKHAVDSWYKYRVGSKFSRADGVQVVLPPLYQADGEHVASGGPVELMTQAAVFGVSSR